MSVPKIGKENMISLKIVSRFCLKASCTHNSPHTTHTQKHLWSMNCWLQIDRGRRARSSRGSSFAHISWVNISCFNSLTWDETFFFKFGQLSAKYKWNLKQCLHPCMQRHRYGLLLMVKNIYLSSVNIIRTNSLPAGLRRRIKQPRNKSSKSLLNSRNGSSEGVSLSRKLRP